MGSATEPKRRWPDALYAYLRYGWGEWLAVLAVCGLSIGWCAWNFASLASSGFLFVWGGRYGPPGHWAAFAAEPLSVAVYGAVDLIWLAAASLGFVAAALWIGRRLQSR
ncbi:MULTISPECIES: hypothetical protein [unclassified Caulobacter]|uniref:hypothetical protein n=1 Tax=unclassified Caulobacter TaxID=2648921 RepID=UPI0004A7200D|nr:hypothetical protein [Caulobacter sp. UNC358MFTsu5.1]